MSRITCIADGAITQGAVVKLTGDMKVAISTTAGDATIGVALDSADTTANVLVETFYDVMYGWAGGVIVAGDPIVPTTAGDLIKTVGVNYQFIALEAAAASGNMFRFVGYHVLMGANGVVQSVGKTLTATEIKALFTTAIEIVAAPASGKALIFEKAVFMYDYLTTVFSLTSCTNLTVNYTDKSGATVSGTLAVAGMLDQATDQYRFLPDITTSYTPVAVANLVLKLGGADPTAGLGSLKVTTFYRVVTL